MPSPGLQSAFSPYTDSPASPAPFPFPHSNRNSGPSDSLLHPPKSPYPVVEPSPVDSNGTEIEDVEQEDEDEGDIRSPLDIDINSPASQTSQSSHKSLDMLARLDTSIPARSRADSDEAPQSVIHAPSGFKQFAPQLKKGLSTSPTDRMDNSVVSPVTPESNMIPDEKRSSGGFEPSPINTQVPKAGDRATPRAQTRQEAEEEWKRRSRASTSLEDIAELDDIDRVEETELEDNNDDRLTTQTLENFDTSAQEVAALQTALTECWTLCNTLANLSSTHRERIFNYHGKTNVQESAWRSCWRLCQSLYESRNEDHSTQVKPTLEMCREFCQSLFEARSKGDEISDSVLRVSFELNNHLYNTQDRNLPEAFRERTLDFYLTLCHRLMKQRTSLPQETDSLLRACWSLAEMLFSLRQNKRDGKPADEELLGSAVQACWELCDLFREGWTQIRPDRGTPRPSQSTFSSSYTSPFGSHMTPSERSSSQTESYHSAPSIPPETPTTIFDDSTSVGDLSPDEPNVPNILVLGPENSSTRTHNRWSSAASTLSGYSESSQRTSSTATAGREDSRTVAVKGLILKAAQNAGFTRNSGNPLATFVKALPSNSFGTLPWQVKLLENYRKLVLSDPTLRGSPTNLPSRRFSAVDVARGVQQIGRSEQLSWLRDLYRNVFGFLPEDSPQRKNVTIQT
ncbi:hypothetical protein M501DRAFT_933677 [Patellaria atrata CBS 101060]|uniref:DUF7624 domain-containing protein n=1 Tax=Patellaria atrata CBS 101060 TaxID=1346257 RepID=A0A9P4SB43_9PEZI|nr:hypothetical protein M501DRAFT_933677 [Patellaria atrata CBS 101060]